MMGLERRLRVRELVVFPEDCSWFLAPMLGIPQLSVLPFWGFGIPFRPPQAPMHMCVHACTHTHLPQHIHPLHTKNKNKNFTHLLAVLLCRQFLQDRGKWRLWECLFANSCLPPSHIMPCTECVCARAHSCACLRVCENQRSTLDVILQEILTFLFEAGSLISQWTPGFRLPCSPGLGLQAHTPLPAFNWGWGIELRSSCLHSKHFTKGPISPAPCFLFFLAPHGEQCFLFAVTGHVYMNSSQQPSGAVMDRPLDPHQSFSVLLPFSSWRWARPSETVHRTQFWNKTQGYFIPKSRTWRRALQPMDIDQFYIH